MAKVNKRINTLTQLTDSNISMSGNLPLDLNNSEQTNRIKLSDTIKTPYATCNTAAATAVKVCEIQNFKDFALVGSLPIAVKFTYQNTAENVKLQIKYTDADGSAVTLDAKNAYAMNSPEKAIGYGDIPASSFVEFYYDSVADCFYMTDAPCGFGLGTCPTNTASATSQPTLAVTLSNNNAIALPTGYAFKVSFTYNYAYAGQPLMSVNGGTALPVTVGGVAAGAGAFAAGRSYTFIATGSNFDCLSNVITDDLSSYAKNSEVNTRLDKKQTLYKSLSDLGLTKKSSLEIIINTMADNSILVSDAYNITSETLPNNYSLLIISKTVYTRVEIKLITKDDADVYYMGLNDNKPSGTWQKLVKYSELSNYQQYKTISADTKPLLTLYTEQQDNTVINYYGKFTDSGNPSDYGLAIITKYSNIWGVMLFLSNRGCYIRYLNKTWGDWVYVVDSDYINVSNGVLPTYSEWTSPCDLIQSCKNNSEKWVATYVSLAAELYTKNIIPVNAAGMIHVVRTNGRCLVEYYTDGSSSKHYYYVTSSPTEPASWFVNTSTKV